MSLPSQSQGTILVQGYPYPHPVDMNLNLNNTLIMPMPTPIYSTLSKDLTDKIEASVKEIGMYATAQKYCKEAGMSFWGLYNNLKHKAQKGKIETEKGIKNPFIHSKERKPQKLSKEEKIFLEELKSGKKDISEISRLVAVKVFEKMLKYPDDFKFYDFYQAQLLQLKQEEQKSKNTIAQELINRLFAGKLPPTHCPKCGTEIIKIETVAAIEEGELVKDE